MAARRVLSNYYNQRCCKSRNSMGSLIQREKRFYNIEMRSRCKPPDLTKEFVVYKTLELVQHYKNTAPSVYAMMMDVL